MARPDPIGIVWHYTLELRGRALLELLCSSIERHTDLKLTGVGPHRRDVDLTPKLIESRLRNLDGGLRLRGRQKGTTLLTASVDFDAKPYNIPSLNWSSADVEFQHQPRKPGDAVVSYDAIRNVFADLCEPRELKWADADLYCIYGHKRYGDLQDAWKAMKVSPDITQGVGWLSYFSNAYLEARGQDEDLLTKAGLTIFKRLSHGVLTQTDEIPLLDPDAYIDRLITIAKALRNPDYKPPPPPPRTFDPAKSGTHVLVKKRKR